MRPKTHYKVCSINKQNEFFEFTNLRDAQKCLRRQHDQQSKIVIIKVTETIIQEK